VNPGGSRAGLGLCTVDRAMAEGVAPKPRRRPKQARSAEIVKAIEEACVRILGAEGPEALTTNRIAEVAGVNIASLYRYFPNKDAILAELYERRLATEAAALDGLHDRAAEIDALSLEATMALLVDTYAEHRARLLALHGDFYRRHARELDLGDRTNTRYARSWRQQSAAWLATVLERHRASIGVEDVPRACFLILAALQGIMGAAVVARPESLADAAFRADVARMLLRYLRP
jgi:AcrR family transcriptional regulator